MGQPLNYKAHWIAAIENLEKYDEAAYSIPFYPCVVDLSLDLGHASGTLNQVFKSTEAPKGIQISTAIRSTDTPSENISHEFEVSWDNNSAQTKMIIDANNSTLLDFGFSGWLLESIIPKIFPFITTEKHFGTIIP